MGNCIETCMHNQKENQSVEEIKPPELLKENNIGINKEDQKSGAALRIKIVLTKEELELLILQLKNKEGQRLEDVLDEIERSRKRLRSSVVGSWKPSLECITESPEVPDHMDR
ncbi:hypothetical protein ACH5RR_041721 [Cinchona calisaya]|uniref:Uncharacterized protein n=1 Tax=Cinchona calisaya TaxID=153742 RepID=A0ABD2XUD1_9GENT